MLAVLLDHFEMKDAVLLLHCCTLIMAFQVNFIPYSNLK